MFKITDRNIFLEAKNHVSCSFSEILEEEEEKIDGVLGKDIIVAADEDVVDDSPADCCPEPCYVKFPFLAGDDDSPFWQGWAMLRLKTFRLIENTYFETAVITMILLSSLALVRHHSSVHLHKQLSYCL